jgi:cephalosporin hydroxylase
MSVIRINVDDAFSTDSYEYEILQEAVSQIGDTPGAIVEIGTRRGGSARIIIDTLAMTGNTRRHMFCIDPYGNIPIEVSDKSIRVDHVQTDENNCIRLDYTNTMRNRIIPSLYYYAYQAGLNFTFFCMEDSEFFKRFADGVPVYNDEKEIVDTYAFVFFDGPHTNHHVEEELKFFLPRTREGSILVFDDMHVYDHDELIEPILFANGFETLLKGKVKSAYIKK